MKVNWLLKQTPTATPTSFWSALGWYPKQGVLKEKTDKASDAFDQADLASGEVEVEEDIV